jgi:Zn ribbon nucleic-acid-binding protein
MLAVTTRCPQCHEGVLKSWAELNDEEREVVKRLPAASEYSAAERERLHHWCVRCWHETSAERADA